MSAIAYCEEAFAILRAQIASELDSVKGELTALVAVLQDDTSKRADALAHAGAALQALSLMSVEYEPTHDQKAITTVNTPTPKPPMPEPVEKKPVKKVEPAVKVEKKK